MVEWARPAADLAPVGAVQAVDEGGRRRSSVVVAGHEAGAVPAEGEKRREGEKGKKGYAGAIRARASEGAAPIPNSAPSQGKETRWKNPQRPSAGISQVGEVGEERTMRRLQACALVAGLAATALACAAGAPVSQPSVRLELPGKVVTPRGPGSVFPSVEAAAVDGLAYAHLEARRADRERFMHGSTIYAEQGGYSYGPIQVARPSDPDHLTLALKPSDVAHFHTYPAGRAAENRLNEVHSPTDRANVEEMDPRGRPLFILTPSLRVRGYDPRRGVFDVAGLAGKQDGPRVLAHQE